MMSAIATKSALTFLIRNGIPIILVGAQVLRNSIDIATELKKVYEYIKNKFRTNESNILLEETINNDEINSICNLCGNNIEDGNDQNVLVKFISCNHEFHYSCFTNLTNIADNENVRGRCPSCNRNEKCFNLI